MPYIGNQPGTGVRSRFIYTATASQTTFTGADNNSKTLKYSDADYIDVYLNGVCLVPVTDYAASTKTSVVLTQAASLNDTLEVVAYDIATISDTVSKADGGTFEANVTFADGADIITATAGTDNVRLGENAGDSITSGGDNNVAIGTNAGTAITTGDLNTFVGSSAGAAVATTASNTAVGAFALDAATGSENTALGAGSLGDASNTGTKNTAVGFDALNSTTSGSQNTVMGYEAGKTNEAGGYNTFVGYKAAYTSNNSGNALNTCIGYQAGYSLTTGSQNCFVGQSEPNNGYGAGHFVTTGTKNTILGGYNGNQDSVDIRTLSNFIVLSDGDGFPRAYWDNTGRMAVTQAPTSQMAQFDNTNTSYGSVGVASNVTRTSTGGTYFFFSARDTSAGTYRFYVQDDGSIKNTTGTYAAISDEKLKENIEDSGSQWDDIKAIRVRKFSMKEFNKDKPDMIGVIAQEVEAAGMDGLVDDVPDRDEDGAALETSTKTFKYSILYMKAIKALQEAMTRIETLETQNTTQATQIADLITRVTALEGE